MKIVYYLAVITFIFSCGNGGSTTGPTQPAPDSKIAFRSTMNNSNGLYTINVDGTDLHRISFNFNDSDPVWAPGSNKTLVYAAYRGIDQFEAVRVDADGENALVLGEIDLFSVPAWSPDGTQILFKSDGDLIAVSADGTTSTTIADDMNLPEEERPVYYEYSWFPDGSKILFSAVFNGDGGPPGIYSVNPDGSALQNVFRHETIRVRSPKISPDGNAILFMDRENQGFQGDIYVVNIDGTDLLQVDGGKNNIDPEWSPDGSKIAVFQLLEFPNSIPPNNLIVFDTKDNYSVHFQQQILFHVASREGSIAWSPDSRKLLTLTLDAANPALGPGIRYLDINTGSFGSIIASGGTLGPMSWSSEIK